MLPRPLELICEYEPIWFSSWGTNSLLGGQRMLILNLLQRVTLQYYGSCYRLLMQIKRFLTIRIMKNSDNKTFKAFMLSGHQSTGFIVTGRRGIPLQCSIVWLTNLYCLYFNLFDQQVFPVIVTIIQLIGMTIKCEINVDQWLLIPVIWNKCWMWEFSLDVCCFSHQKPCGVQVNDCSCVFIWSGNLSYFELTPYYFTLPFMNISSKSNVFIM